MKRDSAQNDLEAFDGNKQQMADLMKQMKDMQKQIARATPTHTSSPSAGAAIGLEIPDEFQPGYKPPDKKAENEITQNMKTLVGMVLPSHDTSDWQTTKAEWL